MRIFWKDLVMFNAEGGAGGGGGAGDGGQGGGQSQGAGGQSQGGDGGSQQQSSGAPKNLLEAAQRAASGQQGDGQQQQQQQSGGQQTQQAYYPQDLPQNFRGTNDRETIDKLYGEISSRPKPPATAKDYKYEFDDGFTKKFGDLKDDPVLPIWSEIMHELGVDNKTAQAVVPKMFEKLAEAGLIPEPFNEEKEFALLEPGEKDPTRRKAKATARVNAVATKLQGLETRKVLTKADNARLSIMMLDAANITAFEKVMNLIPGEHGLQGGGGGNPIGAYGWDDADKEMADERYSSTSPKFDPKFRAQVDDKMRQLPKRGGYFLNGRPA